MKTMLEMLAAYWRVLRHFRDEDLEAFPARHAELYKRALETGDHSEVIQSFYGLLAPLYTAAYGPSWHFVPPEHRGQARLDAVRGLHQRIADLLEHAPGRRLLDVGSGVGGAMRDVAAHSGGEVVGITMAPSEVETSKRASAEAGLAGRCRTVQGDAQALPFDDGYFDGAYAIYSLKYFPTLKKVFGEIQRVLKPGGQFVVYDIVKTDDYDPLDTEHRRIVEGFEQACGMPPLHSDAAMIAEAAGVGLRCVERRDLSGRFTWYHYFESPLLPWLVMSPVVRRGLVPAAEFLGLLPRGFREINDGFISGIVEALLRAGRRDILSGSSLLRFAKPVA